MKKNRLRYALLSLCMIRGSPVNLFAEPIPLCCCISKVTRMEATIPGETTVRSGLLARQRIKDGCHKC